MSAFSRACLALTMAIPLCAAISLALDAPARASTRAPTVWSFYERYTVTATDNYTEGCNQARYNAEEGINSLVWLDFGAQVNTSGTQRYVGHSTTRYNVSQFTVWTYSIHYADGYNACKSGGRYLVLAIGTNNDGALTKAAGEAFAQTVNTVTGWVRTYYATISVFGADDIEASWSSYTKWLTWYSGYSTKDYYLLDYGAATGCRYATTSNSSCNNGWTRHDVYEAAYGETLDVFTPEIYYSGQAHQWHTIETHTSSMYPYGPLNEAAFGCPTTLSAATAWAQLNAYWPGMGYALQDRRLPLTTSC